MVDTKKAKDAAKKTSNAMNEKANQAVDSLKDEIVDIADDAKEIAWEALNKAKDTAWDLADKAADGVRNTAEKINAGMDWAEKKFDNAVDNATAKVEGMIPDSAKKWAKKAEEAATKVAGIVDDAAHKIDDVVDSLLPERTGADLTLEAVYEEKVSRMFVLRLLWMFPMYFVFIVYGTIASVASIIHRFYMIINWHRNKFLWTIRLRFTRTYTKWSAYISWHIDKRPEIIEE